MTHKASFEDAWRHGKRCVIPALSFDEPNGLAGLWNTWIERRGL